MQEQWMVGKNVTWFQMFVVALVLFQWEGSVVSLHLSSEVFTIFVNISLTLNFSTDELSSHNIHGRSN